MRVVSRTVAVCAAVCLYQGSLAAQSDPLTLAEVLARARERAPGIVSARLAVDETRARLLGAAVRFETNPELEAAVGNRSGPNRRSTDFELSLSQAFEPSSRRAERVAGATAAVAQSTARVEETTRVVLHAAASAYYRTLHAQERIRLLDAAAELASTVYSVSDRRFRAGDIAVLDVNIARASLARVRAEIEAAEALRATVAGDLKTLLQLAGDVRVQGELAPGMEANLNELLQTAAERPGLRALEAAIAEAEAEARLGRTFRTPEYGVGVGYSREEGDQIILGALTVTLPMFSSGQQLQAAGTARASRLRAELQAARNRVQVDVRTAHQAYERRMAALRVLEADAIPGLEENEALMTRSFEVGQLGLPELLFIRREILDTRHEYLDALLEAALARVDLDASAGVLR